MFGGFVREFLKKKGESGCGGSDRTGADGVNSWKEEACGAVAPSAGRRMELGFNMSHQHRHSSGIPRVSGGPELPGWKKNLSEITSSISRRRRGSASRWRMRMSHAG